MKVKKRDPKASSLILGVRSALENGQKLSYDTLLHILKSDHFEDTLYTYLKDAMKICVHDPVITSIELPSDSFSESKLIDYLFRIGKQDIDVEVRILLYLYNYSHIL